MQLNKVQFNLANPILLYTIVWIFAIFLNSLKLTKNVIEINDKTLFLIFSNIISFYIIYLFVFHIMPQKNVPSKEINFNNSIVSLLVFSKRLVIIWIFGVVSTIFYEQGFPLIWALKGSPKTYADFGLPTINGFLNSIYFFSTTSLFVAYLKLKKRKILLLLIILLLWPVIAFARSVLLGSICQIIGAYFILRKTSFKGLIKIFLLAILIVVLFGIIGDYRGTESNFNYMIVEEYKNIFDILPSGILWFYIYITSPLNNVIANINELNPNYIPYYSISNLFPTLIRNVIYPVDFNRSDSFELLVENLNVSTYYAGFLSDFGVFFSILIVSFLQFIITIVYFYAKNNNLWAILSYSVFFQCIVFSIFYNLLSSQVYLMQIFISLYFKTKSKSHLNTGKAGGLNL